MACARPRDRPVRSYVTSRVTWLRRPIPSIAAYSIAAIDYVQLQRFNVAILRSQLRQYPNKKPYRNQQVRSVLEIKKILIFI